MIRAMPWLPFLILALMVQQANMLTYKFGGKMALPVVFLIYSFAVQSALNFVFAGYFKNKGFPLILQGRMRLWVLVVMMIYIVNELLFMSLYRMGAPYSLMMMVFALTGVVIMTVVGVTIIKEKMTARQAVGILLAMVAIAMVRLG